MRPEKKRVSGLLLVGLMVVLAINACNYPTQSQPTSTPDLLPTLVETLLATLAPTSTEPAPERLLTVCLGKEPDSLFLYGDSSLAARAVRQAIYDGPVDWIDYTPVPVILEKIPRLADGDVAFEPVQVAAGELIVDAADTLVALQEGVLYLPSGCRDTSCAATYSGKEPVAIDQMVAAFTLKPDVQWSDGSPLTAADSVYSYRIAQALYPQVQADLLRRTSSYQVLDERRVEWRGLPGHRQSQIAANFFSPLPEHAWGDIPPEELAGADGPQRTPLGWGAYQVDEWIAGDHITLRVNPYYFRSAEGLPRFDQLVYRFIPGEEEALIALLAGECDILDESAMQGIDLGELDGLDEAGRAKVLLADHSAWEQLVFGIQPSDPSQPALMQARQVRQAIAQCIDRQTLVNRLSAEQAAGAFQVLTSYVPPDHPAYNAEARQYSYDPAAAADLLQSAGWVDLDGDPATPRVSQGVVGQTDETPFTIELLAVQSDERQLEITLMRESLSQCGIQVEVRYLAAGELFAPGPQGPVFGRHFQLAQVGWQAASEPACFLYTTGEIPGPYPDYPKGWGGANASGYSNAEFDQTCLRAHQSLADDPGNIEAHYLAQAIFADELPALPLYSRAVVAAVRPDLCGLELDPSGDSILWSLESVNYGEDCPQ